MNQGIGLTKSISFRLLYAMSTQLVPNTFLILAIIVCLRAVGWCEGARLHLVGDSTLCLYPTVPANPQRGWGQELPGFFKSGFEIKNHAIGGQSTLGFIAEKRWERVLAEVAAGDFVLIQFGHNDQKRDNPARFADADTVYADNLRRMLADVRRLGAEPLLATSVVRRQWRDGRFVDSLGDYPAAARRVAAETSTPLLELHVLTRQLVEAHGQEGSKRLFLWIPAGVYERQPGGWRDNSHFSAYGAGRVAALAVQELIRLDHPLVAWLESSTRD